MCYNVYLNNEHMTILEARNETEALEKAAYLYGLEVDVKEIPCKHPMNSN